MNTCVKCGKTVPDDSVFCPFCGAEIPKKDEEHALSGDRLVTADKHKGAGDKREETSTEQKGQLQSQDTKSVTKRRKRKLPKWAIFVLSACAVLAVATAVILIAFPTLFHKHNWQSATCTKPVTCSICGDTVGSPLGHRYGYWKTLTEPTLNKEGIEKEVCPSCGKTLSERKTTKTIEFSNGEFNFTKNEFVIYFKRELEDVGAAYLGQAIWSEGEEIYPIYSADGKDTLKAAVWTEENRNGNVTEVFIVGDRGSVTRVYAMFVFKVMINKGIDTEEVDSSLDKYGYYKKDGLKLVYENSGSIDIYYITGS